MILMPLGESDLRSLAFHFASQEDELVTACRRLILELSSQLWFWFELPYADWPYKLLQLVTGNVAGGAIGNVDVADELFGACDCCLDDHMGIKVICQIPIKLLILPGATLSLLYNISAPRLQHRRRSRPC